MAEYINPNYETVRIASTSGHVVFLRPHTPVNILPHMESEARAKGCMPMSSCKALAEKIMAQETGNKDAPANTSVATPGPAQPAESGDTMTEDQKLKKVVEAIQLMLDADAGENYFTANGLPRAASVNELAGFEVSKELRETAWDLVKEEVAGK